jgi:small nuclear ribonucleoprotein (snRNP)-like protein
MVRSVDTFFINGESFINYCSDSDFNYTIYIGQKCKVFLRNEKCFIGTLYEVDSNKNTFSIKQNNGEIIKINCVDIEEIFSEEEIGTIN